MTRYTRFFSAVAAGINITYISPSLVQEISSPGTYNLNTHCTVIHTHTVHSTIQTLSSSSCAYTHTHTQRDTQTNTHTPQGANKGFE